MTSAQTPAARRSSVWARGWRDFRRWRRGRPFWGGLLSIVAGVEMLLSGGVNLGQIEVRVGLPGFHYYVIPAVLILCGLLGWFSPAQRIFYGIVATLIAIYSLVGVNFGGFGVGMVLGILGGALIAAWTPVVPIPPDTGPQEPDTSVREVAEAADEAGEATPTERPAAMDDLRTGPLTDVLPAPTTAPVPLARPPDPGRGSGPHESTGLGEPEPRGNPPLLSVAVPIGLAAAVLVVLPGPRVAHAAPCPTPTPATTAPQRPTPSIPATSPSPLPSASAAAGEDGNLIEDVIDGIGDLLDGLLGGGREAEQAEPTATPSSSPAPPPAPSRTASAPPPSGSAPSPCPTGSRATAAPKPKILAVPPGQPVVSDRPGLLTGTRVTMSGLSFDGVVSLPTHAGTIRALQFSMTRSTTTDFKLVTTDRDGKPTSLVTQALTVEDNVKFYTNRFTGKVFGLLELTFTPDAPPPLILPEMFFTDPEISLVFIACDQLTARPILHLTTP